MSLDHFSMVGITIFPLKATIIVNSFLKCLLNVAFFIEYFVQTDVICCRV